MTYFMCHSCGRLVRLETNPAVPPHECPDCGEACAFVNVTSYRPEFGVGNPDTEIMGLLLAEARNRRGTALAQRTQGLMSSRVDDLCREAALVALRELLAQKKKAELVRVREGV